MSEQMAHKASESALRRRQLDPITVEDREAAQPLMLHRTPTSAAAVALVDSVLAKVDARGGIKQRPSSIEKARNSIGALLSGLMEAEANGRWAAHGMSKTAFPAGRGFRYDTFEPVTNAMRDLGYLKMSIGRARWHTWGQTISNHGGRTTRFKMTSALIDLARSLGIEVNDWAAHWGGAPRKPMVNRAQPRLVLNAHKARLGRYKDDPKPMPYDPAAERPAALLAGVEAINTYLEKQQIGGISFPGLRRIFNDGDLPGFDWQWGGRYYSLKGGDRYEALGREERFRALTINGEPIGEADIRASHLTLLHGLLGQPLDPLADPYDIDGFDRNAVKAFVSQALGASKTTFRSWSKDAKEKYAEAAGGRDLPEDYPLSKVRAAVLERHPVLGGLESYGTSTLDLQFHEAEVLRRAMAILREREDAPALPLHDALLVPTSRLEAAERALKAAFEEYFRDDLGRLSTVTPMVSLEDH